MSSEVPLQAVGKVLEMGEHDVGSAGWGAKLALFGFAFGFGGWLRKALLIKRLG